MKKSLMLSLALISLFLSACSRTADSTPQQSETKQNPTSGKEASAASQATSKEDAEKAYQSVLEDYQLNGRYGQYAFYDIDQNGSLELLLGQNLNGDIHLGLLVYLKNGQPEPFPQETPEGDGYRIALTLYEDGTVLYDRINSYNGDGQAKAYRLEKNGSELAETKSAEIQVGEQTAEEALGLSDQAKLNLSGLDWQAFDSSAQNKGLDIDGISRNDYSSLSGTWQNASGQALVFDDLGVVGDGKTLSTDVIIENGYLRTNVIEAISSYEIIFVPAGVTLDPLGYKDASDTTKARIWIGQSRETISEAAAFYYKID